VELYIGTSGYSNKDWLGLLYPEGTKATDFLEIYAENFNAVELNSSFYAIPGIKAFEGMVKKSKAKVRFSIKIPQAMTHKRDARAELYQQLLESVEPLRQVGMLGPFLAQFPYSFHRTPQNRLYLASLIDYFKNENLAIEFRHWTWDKPEVRKALSAANISLVAVDFPRMKGLFSSGFKATNDIAYIRMHGRNSANWWSANSAAARHDYLYSNTELGSWVEAIKNHAESLSQVYLMMENTTKGHALKNLESLRDLFADIGIEAEIYL